MLKTITNLSLFFLLFMKMVLRKFSSPIFGCVGLCFFNLGYFPVLVAVRKEGVFRHKLTALTIRAINHASAEFNRIQTDAENFAAQVKSLGATLAGLGAAGFGACNQGLFGLRFVK